MSRSRSATRSRSPVKRKTSADAEEGVSPFLIRVFVTKGKHTPLIDFDEGRLPLRDEFQVYAWKHSTPSALIALLYPAFPPPYRSPLARFSFRHVYVDASQRGLYRSTDLVSFSGRDLMAKLANDSSAAQSSAQPERNQVSAMDMELDDGQGVSGSDPKGARIEEKSLDDYGFITGDLLSVSLFVPEPKASLQRGGGPGGLGAGAGAGGPSGPGGPGAQSFGWRDAQLRNGNGDAGRGGPGERDRPWGRGGPLPPQGSARDGGGRGGFGRDSERDREPAGGGNWRGGPIGIRGAGAAGRRPRSRSRSPDRDRERERNGNRYGDRARSRSRSRSRSPIRR